MAQALCEPIKWCVTVTSYTPQCFGQVDPSRSMPCGDVDGDPVFLASSAFMLRRTQEGHPELRFQDIKDVRAGA